LAWLRLLAVVTVTAFAAPEALAHAVLLEQSVGDGARLAAAPTEIRLRFNETVTPVLVRVLDAKGNPVTASAAVSEVDTTVIIAMPHAISTGNYVVTYRVISADSHPVGGSFVFAVGDVAPQAGLAARGAPPTSEAAWTAIAAAVQAVFYGALLLAAGGAFFEIAVAREPAIPRAEQGLIVGAALVAAAAIMAAIGVEGALSADVPLSAIVDADIWRIGLGTSVATNAFVTIPGLALVIAGATGWAGRFGPWALAGGGILAIAGLTVTGHAAGAPPAWLAAPVLGLHALCAAYWVGALIPLHRRAWSENSSALTTDVRRFSLIALIAVTVLLICGLLLAVLQVKEPSALIATAYGQRLLVKICLVTALLGCAAYNKLRLTPRLARGEHRAALSLRRMIEIELALFAAIVVATALLGQSTPPRALQEQAAEHEHMEMPASGFTVATFAGDRIAVVAVTPARAGANGLVLTLLDPDGALMKPVQVTVFLSNPALGIEASEHRAVVDSQGDYDLSDADFPIAGTWTVEIEALVTDFEAANFATEVPIR
jgi:copper transport protein